jgi:hypothetical protein
MTELHELLGRELDPIDDVRRRFEESYTDNYFNPVNGDWISDDYARIIDLSTKPGALSDKESGQLGRSITRLNGKYDYIQIRLGGSSLLGAYNNVAEQVNAVNSTDATRSGIPLMQSSLSEDSI